MEAIIKVIFEYSSAVLSLLVFLFTACMFIINKIRQKCKRVTAEEEKEAVEEELTEQQARFKLINEIIPLAISTIETTPTIKGPTKKMLAMSKILLSCNTLGIDFSKYESFIDVQVENLINFSKAINPRDKDIIKHYEGEKLNNDMNGEIIKE